MKLDVPFYVQGKNECGPVNLQMILEYFGEKRDKEEIKKLVDSGSNGITWGLGLANAASYLGFPSEFYSTSIEVNPSNYDLEYYQKETDGLDAAKEKINMLLKKARKYGVKIEEKSITLKEILSKINEDCLAIVLVDWSKLNNTNKFIGHFLTIVGYDDKNVFVHNPGPNNPESFKQIKKELLDLARKSKGTDEDIILIHRKSS
jgi:uncharacterized protein YvpB